MLRVVQQYKRSCCCRWLVESAFSLSSSFLFLLDWSSFSPLAPHATRTVRTASTTDVSSSFPTSSTKPDRRRCPDEPLRAHVRISWTMNCLGPLYHLHAIWTSQLNIKETRARPTGRQASMHHAASRSHILDIYHPHFSARMQLHRMN